MDIEKEGIILDAAMSIFLKYGYQKTTMDDIAHEAMIGKGTIYYYFKTKEDIFIAILKNLSCDARDSLREKINNAKSFEEKLQIFLVEPCNWLNSNSKLLVQAMNDDSPAFMKKLNEFKSETFDFNKALLHEFFYDACEAGQLKRQYAESIERILEIILKWMMFSGEYFKFNISEDKINEVKEDYLLLSNVIVNGLIKKEVTE